MGYIYKIVNKVNGKTYIGLTRKSIEHRWLVHKNTYKYKHYPLYRAMQKYGIDNFEISILEQCDDCNSREIYWIGELDTYNDGYNATTGGDFTIPRDLQKQAVSKPIVCNELDLEFPSVVDAARWFADNGYAKTWHAAEVGINRVLKGYKKSYRKYTFNYKKEKE